MTKRKLTFNIHENPDEGNVITPQLLQHVLKETPFPGAIVWKLTNGKQLNAFRRDYVKSEIYDVWISDKT